MENCNYIQIFYKYVSNYKVLQEKMLHKKNIFERQYYASRFIARNYVVFYTFDAPLKIYNYFKFVRIIFI